MKNGIIIAVEILLIFAVVFVVIIYVCTDNTEGKYTKAKADIKSKNFTAAMGNLSQVPHYKDSSELERMLYPESLYYSIPKGESVYTALKLAQNEVDRIKKDPSMKKYYGEMAKLEKAIQFKLEENQVVQQNNAVIAKINACADRIKTGDYGNASKELEAIQYPNGEPEKSELLAYIHLLQAVQIQDKKAIKEAAKSLDPNYTGILSSDINKCIEAYLELGQWGSLYSGAARDLVESGVIRLGMKKLDVESIIKNPARTSVTGQAILPMDQTQNAVVSDEHIISEFGNFEKMVYRTQILYFEANILHAIKRI